MNRTIWNQAIREAFWLLVGCMAVMFVFHWLFVYLTSFINPGAFFDILGELPPEMQGMFGIDPRLASTWTGRLAMAYVDPTVVVISALWAITRGSNSVSGPLDRGTLELILAQPVSRMTLLVSHTTISIIGAAFISVAAWLGTKAGIYTVSVEVKEVFFLKPERVLLSELVTSDYIHSAINLFSLTLFVIGLTTLVSACGRYRWRTIGLVGGFYIVQIIFKMCGLASTELKAFYYFTFLGAYWPQALAVEEENLLAMALRYNGILLGGGVLFLVAAAVVFRRRDLPAPL